VNKVAYLYNIGYFFNLSLRGMKTMKKKERKEGRKEIGIGFDPFQLLS
jgi:hypothetical protein